MCIHCVLNVVCNVFFFLLILLAVKFLKIKSNWYKRVARRVKVGSGYYYYYVMCTSGLILRLCRHVTYIKIQSVLKCVVTRNHKRRTSVTHLCVIIQTTVLQPQSIPLHVRLFIHRCNFILFNRTGYYAPQSPQRDRHVYPWTACA